MSSIAAQKRLLRTEAGKRRDTAAADGDIGTRLTEMFEQHVQPPVGIAISGYHPIGNEANVLPLLNKLRDQGFVIALRLVGPASATANAPRRVRPTSETRRWRRDAPYSAQAT